MSKKYHFLIVAQDFNERDQKWYRIRLVVEKECESLDPEKCAQCVLAGEEMMDAMDRYVEFVKKFHPDMVVHGSMMGLHARIRQIHEDVYEWEIEHDKVERRLGISRSKHQMPEFLEDK